MYVPPWRPSVSARPSLASSLVACAVLPAKTASDPFKLASSPDATCLPFLAALQDVPCLSDHHPLTSLRLLPTPGCCSAPRIRQRTARIQWNLTSTIFISLHSLLVLWLPACWRVRWSNGQTVNAF